MGTGVGWHGYRELDIWPYRGIVIARRDHQSRSRQPFDTGRQKCSAAARRDGNDALA
jgi:hypothetical protein